MILVCYFYKFFVMQLSIAEIRDSIRGYLEKDSEIHSNIKRILFGLLNVKAENLDEKFNECREYLWEKLNSGHWKNIPDYLRKSYLIANISYVSNLIIFNANASKEFFLRCLYKIDDALIMGKPLIEPIAENLAYFIHSQIPKDTSIINKFPKIVETDFVLKKSFGTEDIKLISRYEKPDLMTYLKLLETGDPFIIVKSIENTAYFKNWSIEYLSGLIGYRTIPVEIGSRYTDTNWSQKFIQMNEFIKKYLIDNPDEIGYLAQHQIFLQIPELMNDLVIPDYCLANADVNIWLGPKNTISPLHHDGEKHNLLTQVRGCKYVKIYKSNQTPFLYPFEDRLLYNTSQVDVFKPDRKTFPLFEEARGFHEYLYPGDVLYIPPFAWHYIQSESISLSVNFWWKDV